MSALNMIAITQKDTASRHLNDVQKDDVRRLKSVLHIAHQTIEALGDTGYRASEALPESVSSAKILAETALLLYACARVVACDPELYDIYEKLRHCVSQRAFTSHTQAMVVMDPARALDHAYAYVCLRATGLREPVMETLIESAVNARGARGVERTPYRHLEQIWLKQLCSGFSISLQQQQDVTAAQSVLAHPLDALSATRDDIYALTHALMYVSDFAHRSVVLPREADDLEADLEACLARALDEEDYDLGGEVLLGWFLLKRALPASAEFALRVFKRVEDEVGFLPAPITRANTYATLADEERNSYALATVYHTAYVMGLICATRLMGQPEERAFDTNLCADDARVTLEVLKLHLSADAKMRHWQHDLETLPKREQEKLVPFLLQICVIRAAKQRDFSQLQTLLKLSLETGWIDMPLVRQALALLQRANAGFQHQVRELCA
jgi:hypothetical protein